MATDRARAIAWKIFWVSAVIIFLVQIGLGIYYSFVDPAVVDCQNNAWVEADYTGEVCGDG